MALFAIWILLGIGFWIFALIGAFYILTGRIPSNSRQRFALLLALLVMGVLSGLKIVSMMQATSDPKVEKYTVIGFLLAIPLAFLIGTNAIHLSRWLNDPAVGREGKGSALRSFIYYVLMPIGSGFLGYLVLIGGALIGQWFAK